MEEQVQISLQSVGFNVFQYLTQNHIVNRPLPLIQTLLVEFCQYLLQMRLNLQYLCFFLDQYYMGTPVDDISIDVAKGLKRIRFPTYAQKVEALNHVRSFVCMYNLRKHSSCTVVDRPFSKVIGQH